MIRGALISLVCGLAVGALAPTVALGATVSARTETSPSYKGDYLSYQVIEYRAAAGEINRVRTSAADGALVISDDTALIAAGVGCESVTEHEARCLRESDGPYLTVRLGDQSDTFTSGTDDASKEVFGGPGDDVLDGSRSGSAVRVFGGHGTDLLLGGAGEDTLDGGPGADEARGAGGDDTVYEDDDDGSSDVIDGGPGADTISYVDRRAPVTVDLAAHVAGHATERDRLTSIENAEGSRYGGVLRGDGSRNFLHAAFDDDGGQKRGLRIEGRGGRDIIWGSPRRDRILGGGGDDDIEGYGGGDVLLGGPGADSLEGQGATSEAGVVRCGPGRDRVIEPQGATAIGRDCELIDTDLAEFRLDFSGGDLVATVRMRVPRQFDCYRDFRVGATTVRRGSLIRRNHPARLRVRTPAGSGFDQVSATDQSCNGHGHPSNFRDIFRLLRR